MIRPLLPLALFVTAVTGCGNVPDDPGARIFAAAGVIRGTVLYQGPRPCSMNGHIVGNAILFVFDRRNPPPPNGLSNFPANFGVVTGDVLFANEPRWTGAGPDAYCPQKFGFTETITASAAFAIAPMAAGSYEVQAFYDYTGDFLPTFKFRQLPEQSDVGGGDVDTANALDPINAGNPNYQPHFLPVDVGIPQTGTPLISLGGAIPAFDMPSSGYLTDDVTVSLGQTLTLTRPYFYPEGVTTTLSSDSLTLTPNVAQESDIQAPGLDGIKGTVETAVDYAPILTIPQDIQAYSAPGLNQGAANVFEQVLPHLKLMFGVPNPQPPPAAGSGNTKPQLELPCAIGGTCSESTANNLTNPFHFQLQGGASQGGFQVWQNATFDDATQKWLPLQIAEGQNVPMLWPLVILNKLVDSTPPDHPEDPASLTAQGSAGQPVVIMQGITLLGDNTATMAFGAQPDTLYNTGAAVLANALFDTSTGLPTVFQQDHLMVALRPSVICFSHLFDATPAADQRGTLVTPFSQGQVAAVPPAGSGTIVPQDILNNGDVTTRFQVTGLVNGVQYGCLPKGRYGINVVYPTGQAWTVPNEAGACSGTEGATDYGGLTCTLKPRPVLYSQGNRAVVEVVGPTNQANCQQPGPPASTLFPASTIPAGSPAPAVPVDCLPRCETLPCPGSDNCTTVNVSGGGSAQVCLPPQ